ncbi:MAG: DMT family transporter [Pseudomonadota bacterium]|nr:DMT family transporter [Pseudomonadota bacterium]MEE3072383.1 DMT family transporter [Pseudomonadota bacterium]
MDIRALFAGLMFGLMWSSAFTSARMIVAEAPPLTALTLRFLVSGLIGIAIAYALGQRARLSAAQWRATILFGICQNALYLGLNFIAMQTVEASLASIIASTMPLWVAIVGISFFGQSIRPMGWIGLAAGIAGVALIMGTRVNAGADLYGILLCALGVASLSAATLSVRVASAGGNRLMVVGLQMLVGSAALFPFAAIYEFPTLDVTLTPRLTLAFLYTTLIPGLAATFVWFWLVERIGAVRAATFHFLNPFFGVAIAAILLGEKLGPLDIVGVTIIAAGILAVQLSKAPPQTEKRPA